jgi:hypothetical protein
MVDVLHEARYVLVDRELVVVAVAMSVPAEVIEQPNTDPKLPAERLEL